MIRPHSQKVPGGVGPTHRKFLEGSHSQGQKVEGRGQGRGRGAELEFRGDGGPVWGDDDAGDGPTTTWKCLMPLSGHLHTAKTVHFLFLPPSRKASLC